MRGRMGYRRLGCRGFCRRLGNTVLSSESESDASD
jgi:hypothetical protein